MRSALHPFIFPGLPDARQRGAPNAGFRAERRNRCRVPCGAPEQENFAVRQPRWQNNAEMAKDMETALGEYRKVTEGSYYVKAQKRIATILADQGGIDEAIALLQTVSLKQDKAVDLMALQAELLTRQQRYQEAISVYDRALAIEPDNFSLVFHRALLQIRP
ncbi:MAG: tetratricopeptide repeat protein [Gammaproteobacteria bacterium]|nr:tetratricopeptide repeat protein [Gammaproteobacteria bacterium]